MTGLRGMLYACAACKATAETRLGMRCDAECRNHDGKLSWDELLAGIRTLLKVEPGRPRVRRTQSPRIRLCTMHLACNAQRATLICAPYSWHRSGRSTFPTRSSRSFLRCAPPSGAAFVPVACRWHAACVPHRCCLRAALPSCALLRQAGIVATPSPPPRRLHPNMQHAPYCTHHAPCPSASSACACVCPVGRSAPPCAVRPS